MATKTRPASTESTTAVKPALLRVADRCDACGAQAFVRTCSQAGSALQWCGHHYARHELALAASGASVVADDRHLINVRPSVSANAG